MYAYVCMSAGSREERKGESERDPERELERCRKKRIVSRVLRFKAVWQPVCTLPCSLAVS